MDAQTPIMTVEKIQPMLSPKIQLKLQIQMVMDGEIVSRGQTLIIAHMNLE